MRLYRSLSLTLLALSGSLWALHVQSVIAAEALLRLSDTQQRAAGIKVEAVRAVVGDEGSNAGQAGAGLSLSGQVVLPNARQDLLLANVAGRLESVLVNPGDQVKAGQVVARLYSADLLGIQRAYLGARAQSDLALMRAQRDEGLFKDGIIAESRLQATRAETLQAGAALQEQRQLLKLAGMGDAAVNALRSPEGMNPLLAVVARRAGRVLQQTAQVGGQLDVGAPLMAIAALDLLWIDLQVAKDQAARLALGDRVELAGCAVTGRVIATGVQLEAFSQTVSARAQFESASGCVAPNQYVSVRVSPSVPAKGLVRVPSASVVHRTGKDYVFVQDSAGFRPVPVQIERQLGSDTWLRSGPPLGAQVVSHGVAALKGTWFGLGAGADGAE